VKHVANPIDIGSSLRILQELEQRALQLKDRISRSIKETDVLTDSYSDSMVTESLDLSVSDLSFLPNVSDVEELDFAKLINSKPSPTATKTTPKASSGTPMEEKRPSPTMKSEIPSSVYAKLQTENELLIQVASLEISESCICPSVVWIEYRLPFVSDPIRFRTKLTSPFKTPKLIPLQHNSKNYLTADMVRHVQDHPVEFQVIGLGLPKRAVGAKPVRNSTMQELWVAKGSFKMMELLKNQLQWEGEIMLTEQLDAKQFKPSDITGYLKLRMSLQSGVAKTENTGSPVYFCFQATTCHGIQFRHDPPHDGTLVHLSMCLFKSETKITTIPILWHAEFDKETGVVNNPNSFDFRHVLPLGIDDQFIGQFGKVPTVFEVHASSPKSSNQKSLLGLVRVPFNQLLTAFLSSGKSHMVQLPESDYPVVDPLSGLACGWVRVSMVIGSWKDIEEWRKQVTEQNNENPMQLTQEDQEEEEPIVDTNDVEEDRSPTPVPIVEDITPVASPKKAETVIQVTIHRACGLLGLLEHVIDQPKNENLFEALDFAIQTGANPFVSFDLFPQDDHSGETFTPDTIQTQVVAYTFTPTFDYTIELTIESLDTELLLWIKNGGQAIGRIWHRVPRHLCVDSTDQVCLGMFAVPLVDLINQKNGISKQWYSIGDNAAIQCSLGFQDGFDLEGVVPRQNLRLEQQLEIDLTIRNVHLPLNVARKGLVLRWKNPGNLEQDAFVSEDLQVEVEGSCTVLVDPYHERQTVTFTDPFPKEFLELSFYSKSMEQYFGSCFIKMHKLLVAARAFMRSRNSKVGEPVIDTKLHIIDPDSDNLAGNFAWVRCEFKLIPKSRTNTEFFSVKNDEKISFLQEKAFDESVLLQQSQQKDQEEGPLTMGSLQSAQEEKSSAEEIFQKLSEDIPLVVAETKQVSSPTQPVSPKSRVEYVPIYLSIEKALHLPLVDDPLAKSFQSPFVKQSNLETTPPNAMVTIKIPCGFKENGEILETGVIKSQTSPHWNHELCLHLEKNVDAIDQLKKDGNFSFDVWNIHATDEEFMSTSRPLTKKQLLGTCTVPLSPLFSGLDEIHGWYPIRDYGISKGQLMIRVHPTQDLPRLLSELKQDGYSKVQSRSTGVIRNFETQQRSSFSKLQSRSTILSRSRDTVVREPAISKPQDTWVWDGQQWIHKQLDLQPPALERFEPKFENISIGNKSISKTIDELDLLKQDMLNRLQKLEIGNEPTPSLAQSSPAAFQNKVETSSFIPLSRNSSQVDSRSPTRLETRKSMEPTDAPRRSSQQELLASSPTRGIERSSPKQLSATPLQLNIAIEAEENPFHDSVSQSSFAILQVHFH
jgi:hypothetical protein